MTKNFYKASTLVFAGALALVVGNNTVRDAEATDGTPVQAALQKLEVAKQQLERATDVKSEHRTNAISHTEKAIAELKILVAPKSKAPGPTTERAPIKPSSPTAPAPAPAPKPTSNKAPTGPTTGRP